MPASTNPEIRFSDWREHESHCGGSHQSPINIEVDRVFIANYPEFTFHNYDLIFPERLENNGHTGIWTNLHTSLTISCNSNNLECYSTVELKIEQEEIGEELPFITDGGLLDRYNFVQLHFHWGTSLFGSEHRINGDQ